MRHRQLPLIILRLMPAKYRRGSDLVIPNFDEALRTESLFRNRSIWLSSTTLFGDYTPSDRVSISQKVATRPWLSNRICQSTDQHSRYQADRVYQTWLDSLCGQREIVSSAFKNYFFNHFCLCITEIRSGWYFDVPLRCLFGVPLAFLPLFLVLFLIPFLALVPGAVLLSAAQWCSIPMPSRFFVEHQIGAGQVVTNCRIRSGGSNGGACSSRLTSDTFDSLLKVSGALKKSSKICLWRGSSIELLECGSLWGSISNALTTSEGPDSVSSRHSLRRHCYSRPWALEWLDLKATSTQLHWKVSENEQGLNS